MTLALIVNRRSGPEKGRMSRDRALQAQLQPGDISFFTRDLDELDGAIRTLLLRGVQRVAVVGGDGTLGAVCTSLHRHGQPDALPAIIPLRGGTMNTIARSLGARGCGPESRLHAAQRGGLRAVESGTLRIDERVGFLFSSGVMASFLAEYYRAGQGKPSPATAASVLTKGMASVLLSGPLAERLEQRIDTGIAIDGGAPQPPASYLLIGAGTVTDVGLGFQPFARARGGAGFHAIGHTGTLTQLLRALPKLARGDGQGAGLPLDHLCRELVIDHDGPLDYALDGDLWRSNGPTVLRRGPFFRFLV